MKKLAIIILTAFPVIGFSQMTDDARYEHAVFEIQQNNRSAYTTVVSVREIPFTKEEFETIRTRVLEKNEIFKVELIDEARRIRFYHLDSVDLDDLKKFVIPYKEKIEFAPSEPFFL